MKRLLLFTLCCCVYISLVVMGLGWYQDYAHRLPPGLLLDMSSPGNVYAQVPSVVTGVPGSDSSLPTGLSFTAPELDIGITGSGNGKVCLVGNTSGQACITAPAVAGTANNPLVFSNAVQVPFGTQVNPGITFTGATSTGFWGSATPALVLTVGGLSEAIWVTSVFRKKSGVADCWSSGAPDAAACDVGMARISAGAMRITTGGTAASAGFLELGTTVVGSLPAAAAGNKGWLVQVSDSTAVASEGQTCAGGSSNTAMAVSNGTVWKCF